MEEFKYLEGIIDLCTKELYNGDRNIHATLGFEELKELQNLLNKRKALEIHAGILINKNKELEADLYASNSIINEYIENNKEQEKMIELYEEKLMFALSPTTHELAQDTKQNFKKIIRENINEDTYTIKKVLKAYWNKKAKGE